jgi:hypothetical protein
MVLKKGAALKVGDLDLEYSSVVSPVVEHQGLFYLGKYCNFGNDLGLFVVQILGKRDGEVIVEPGIISGETYTRKEFGTAFELVRKAGEFLLQYVTPDSESQTTLQNLLHPITVCSEQLLSDEPIDKDLFEKMGRAQYEQLGSRKP